MHIKTNSHYINCEIKSEDVQKKRKEKIMFCVKCGAKNEEDAVFCTACGEKLDGSQDAENKKVDLKNLQSFLKTGNKKTRIAAVAAVIVLILIVYVFSSGNKKEEKIALQFVEASIDADAEGVVELLPPQLVDRIIEANGSRKQMLEILEENFLGGAGDAEILRDRQWKISCEALSVEDLSLMKTEEICEEYEERLDIAVSDVKKVPVKITVKVDGMKNSDVIDVYVMKVGKSWYLDLMSTTS